jgi:Reverse transcriptase (RNA-dependent DNA polymerase)
MTGSELGSSRTQQLSKQPPADNTAPPGALSKRSPHNSDKDKVEDILCLQREGGVQFLNHLLAKAVPPDSESPDSTNVHKWTFRDIHKMLSGAQKEWKAACRKELESLCRCNVFELVDPPKDCKIIRNRWVFDLKSDGHKKARLVAKGFSQIEGIDYNEIFLLVVQFETVQMMIALAALKKWHIQGLDIKTTFLYGELDEELYMEQPKGFKVKGQEGKVMHLKLL